MYKLIAVDMDGTLLNEDKKISEENFKAIQEAREKGVQVVLASGRPLKGLEVFLDELDMINENNYVIAFNGALVQNTKTGEVVAQNLMNVDDLKYLYSLSKDIGVNIHFLTHEKCITAKMNRYSKFEADLNNIPLEVENFDEIDESTTIVKTMFIDDPSILEEAIKKLPAEIYEKYTIVRSMDCFLEFLNKEVNKGTGVEALASKLEIEREGVICIGDAENDIHMIKYAGLGVAMGNAFPEVKSIADYITKTNEENGVAHAIKKFVLSA